MKIKIISQYEPDSRGWFVSILGQRTWVHQDDIIVIEHGDRNVLELKVDLDGDTDDCVFFDIISVLGRAISEQSTIRLEEHGDLSPSSGMTKPASKVANKIPEYKGLR